MTIPLPKVDAPALRALHARGIKDLVELSALTRIELIALHGIGAKALVSLDIAMHAADIRLADEAEHELIVVEEWDRGWNELHWAPAMAARLNPPGTYRLPAVERSGARGDRWHFGGGWEVRTEPRAHPTLGVVPHVVGVVLQPLTLRLTVAERTGVATISVTSDETPRHSSHPKRDETFTIWLVRVIEALAAERDELPRFPPRCPISECGDATDRTTARAWFTVIDHQVEAARTRIVAHDDGLPITWADEMA